MKQMLLVIALAFIFLASGCTTVKRAVLDQPEVEAARLDLGYRVEAVKDKLDAEEARLNVKLDLAREAAKKAAREALLKEVQEYLLTYE